MGRRRHNAKARQVVTTDIDDSETNEIQLEFSSNEYGSNDAANALALPSKKRKTNILQGTRKSVRLLSKAQSNNLLKIVDKKNKKANRAALLESLSQVQATSEEVKHMSAISAVQTLGLRKMKDFTLDAILNVTDINEQKKLSSIAGAKKRLRLLKMDRVAARKLNSDPNVVGPKESSDSSSDSEEYSESDDSIECNDDKKKTLSESSKSQNDTFSEEVLAKKQNIINITENNKSQNEEKIPEAMEVEVEELTPNVQVKKGTKMQVARLKLPILGEEEGIMELTHDNEFVIVTGGTGAKKIWRLQKRDRADAKKPKLDPSVVSREKSSDSSSDSEEYTESDDINESNNDENKTLGEGSKSQNNTVTEKVPTKQKNVINITKNNKSPNEEKIPGAMEVEVVKPVLQHPTMNVQVERDPKVQVARLKLPILGEEQGIMELIHENEFVIVAGETGSGKTTQIPQFLYEAGYTENQMIAVTEPRRVATVAMSARVGYELGLTSNEVSYLMRFEGNVTKNTKIKFMTDGVLLKEIQKDFLLSKYSVVIIDEAHERSMYTDILLGLLSRIVPLRRKKGCPLRLIIMSATLRVEDFVENTRLFKVPPPVIQIQSRQFPVTVHFNKHTYSDYVKEAYKKTVKIHTRLPDGGILIFVTGQQEVKYLVRKLKASFPYRKDIDYTKLINRKMKVFDPAFDSEPDDIESDDDEIEKEMKRICKAKRKAKRKVLRLPKINLDDYDIPEDDGQADLISDADSEEVFSDSDPEDSTLTSAIKSNTQPLWVLPLYSMLSTRKQSRVFEAPPAGTRLCVVSTDVAETSLTIPSIKYVVDTGKKKMRVYDHVTGASAWRIVWTSQASAEQRSGRAGRTGPGHAYRLYSSAVYQHDCVPHYQPDLCTRPIDQLLLTLKCMGIDKVVNFPYPTAPNRMQLLVAEKRLEVLGILEKVATKKRKINEEEVLKVTPLGKAVSAFPLLPRYGKMLALSHQFNLLPYAISMISALTVPEVMSGTTDSWPATGNMLLLGDPGVLLRAVGAADHSTEALAVFCAKYGLREKAIVEIRKLRKQLTSEINLSVPGVNLMMDPKLQPPDDRQARLLRQLLLSGLGDQVVKKIGLTEVKAGENKGKYKYAYHCVDLEEPVFLHSESILRKVIPEWLIYQDLYETGSDNKKKMMIRNVTAIEPEWLPVYVPFLCNLGEPLRDPAPRYDDKSGNVKCHLKGTFGKSCWELPTVEIDFPEKIEKYRWFARFLLDGSVFVKLKKYAPSLLLSPSTMIKSWANLQPRTEMILKPLIEKGIGSKNQLLEAWKKTPNFLLAEYLQWVPESAHNEVTLYWPPI